MIMARLAVYAAIAVTLYVNGSYAWSKGGSPADQWAMLGLALAIDGCKCSFLRVASICHQEGRTLAAALLFVLWWPCLAYSTFAGYSYLHTNRATVSTSKQGTAEERQRAQAAHDQATADLKLATGNPLWSTTSACTVALPKAKGNAFCEGIIRLRTDQANAAAILTRIAPTDANPEVTGIATTTGLASERVQFLIAVLPAILVELLASVGFYALGKHPAEKAPRKPVGARLWFWLRWARPVPKTPPATPLEALAAKPNDASALTAAKPVPPKVWKVPQSA